MVKKGVRVKRRPSFLNRTGLFGFELFMALFGLVTTLVVVDYGVFALFNYSNNARVNADSAPFLGESIIWIVTALFVWLPVTIVFYLRSRSEAEQKPARSSSVLYKVLTSIYYFCVIVGAIILVFLAIYSLVSGSTTPDVSMKDVLMKSAVPALLAVAIHVGMMFAYTKSNRPPRLVFASLYGGFVAVLAVVLLVISIGFTRSLKQDELTVSDLGIVNTAIIDHYYVNKKIPTDLSQISIINNKLKARLGQYEYTPVDEKRYQLCANFLTDSRSDNYMGSQAYPLAYEDYAPYQSFYWHDKGRVCFKLSTEDSFKSDIVDPITVN